MKKITQRKDMSFDVKWNANMDGSLIMQCFENDEQAQVLLQKYHLVNAFNDLLYLLKKGKLTKYQLNLIESIISDVRELQEIVDGLK